MPPLYAIKVKSGDKYFSKFSCPVINSFEDDYKRSWQFVGQTLDEYVEEFGSFKEKEISSEEINEFLSIPSDTLGFWIDCRYAKTLEKLRKLSREYQSCTCPVSNYAEPILIHCGTNEQITAPLTRHEYMSIGAWTMSGVYQRINSALRSNDRSRICDVAPIAKEIMNGLEKLPSFKGTVYRGSSLPLKVEQEHQIGNIVEYTGLTSTTVDLDIANHFKDDSGWLFVITLKNLCKDIQSISRGEGEILCPPGIRFKVIDRDNSERIMYLEEVGNWPAN